MSLLLDICKGLEFLHSHKILHRNLRTDHVFLILVASPRSYWRT